MFERRIKILLGALAGFTLLLVLRAGWLQVVQGADWQARAALTGRRQSHIETSRGRILDVKGRTIAEDAPCVDAALDYRAIDVDAPESREWLRIQARGRLQSRGAYKGSRDERVRLVDAEVDAVKADLKALWAKFAEISGKTPDEIEEVRASIVRRVKLRQRYVLYKRYEEAKQKHDSEQKEDRDSWFRWLTDDSQAGPQIDNFKVTVSEQTETHPILRAIDNDAYIQLDKMRERCPGLELKKGTRRNYPYHDIGCHVVGHMAPVMREDLEADPNVDKDESKKYFYNDMIGRAGLERLAERQLRGARGTVVRQTGRDTVLETVPPQPGQDVRVTIDMELQMRVQEAFLRYVETGDPKNPGKDLRVVQMPEHAMYGAAVVIDVPTGQVRALVSNPTYDVNQFEQLYPTLLKNQVDRPLINRATQAALEPGSTVKPLVGLAAMTAGVLRPEETIECEGFLRIDGRLRKEGRCWVASKFGHLLANPAHHPVPSSAPHPTGFLTFSDACERSCNVYFEIAADRLKMDGLGHWMKEFGLGRITEIGLAEVEGRVPGQVKVPNWRSATWFSGIGQSQVLATPIQMANVAATIARRGTWVRPHLLAGESSHVERRDLKLNAQAVEEAHQGMIAVVNGAAGTGAILRRDDLLVAGKTGTAQAAKFNTIEHDPATGKRLRDENGKVVRKFYEPSTPDVPNRDMPWYRGSGNSGTELGHAWFIGFAPATDPKIAFAVLVEYGGSGGKDAGPVANAILDACLEHGYLQKSK
jgi:penicillin-binding protein 2